MEDTCGRRIAKLTELMVVGNPHYTANVNGPWDGLPKGLKFVQWCRSKDQLQICFGDMLATSCRKAIHDVFQSANKNHHISNSCVSAVGVKAVILHWH